jgi:hypothetical protein
VDIAANIAEFLGAGRQPTGRDASFDYCFNYFQSFRNNRNIDAIVASQNIEMSCLQLGFYLASWGMFRNSPLLEKSSKHYQPCLEKLVAFDRGIWDIDIPDYSDATKVQLVLDCGKLIATSLEHDSPTLNTKVMLGIFGNVPAFDRFFPRGLGLKKHAKATKQNLGKILDFYNANKAAIDGHQIQTLDFLTGQPTGILYSKAKIIDMIGTVEGARLAKDD